MTFQGAGSLSPPQFPFGSARPAQIHLLSLSSFLPFCPIMSRTSCRYWSLGASASDGCCSVRVISSVDVLFLLCLWERASVSPYSSAILSSPPKILILKFSRSESHTLTHTHIHSFSDIMLDLAPSQVTRYSSQCYTGAYHCLSIPKAIVCIY